MAGGRGRFTYVRGAAAQSEDRRAPATLPQKSFTTGRGRSIDKRNFTWKAPPKETAAAPLPKPTAKQDPTNDSRVPANAPSQPAKPSAFEAFAATFRSKLYASSAAQQPVTAPPETSASSLATKSQATSSHESPLAAEPALHTADPPSLAARDDQPGNDLPPASPKYAKQKKHQLLRILAKPGSTPKPDPTDPKVQQPANVPVSKTQGTDTKPRLNSTPGGFIRKGRSLVRCKSRPTTAKKPLAPAKRPQARNPSARVWVRDTGQTPQLPGRSQPALRLTVQRKSLKRVKAKTFKWQRSSPSKPVTTQGSAKKTGGKTTVTVRTVRQKQASRLVRVNGSLYKLSGSGKGKSLKRQATLKPVAKTTGQAAYQRQGSSLRRLSDKVGSPRVGPALPKFSHVTPVSKASAPSRLHGTARKPAKKQRTVSLLAKIRKQHTFVNRLCLTYCRTGRCAAKERGACDKVHDASKVAVCPQWLAGQCAAPGCPLQHTHCKELMPLCMHFIKGGCSKAGCPYLHVRLDPQAPVCEDFLQGYCAKGSQCTKKHLTARMARDLRSVSQPAADTKKRKRAGAEAGKRPKGAATQPPAAQAGSFLEGDVKSADDGNEEKGASDRDMMRPSFLRGLL